MTEQTISDKNGIILGAIKVMSDGRHELRNHSGTIAHAKGDKPLV